MPYRGDPIAEKLDRVAGAIAGAIGLTRLQRRFESGRTIRFRFVPLTLLALAVAGLWVQIAQSDVFGYLTLLVVWLTSGAVLSLSPLGTLRGGPLDEREAALVRSGHSMGLLWVSGITVLGCFVLGMASFANQFGLGSFWTPEVGTDWFALAFFLLAVEANVANITASANLPEDLDDEDA